MCSEIDSCHCLDAGLNFLALVICRYLCSPATRQEASVVDGVDASIKVAYCVTQLNKHVHAIMKAMSTLPLIIASAPVQPRSKRMTDRAQSTRPTMPQITSQSLFQRRLRNTSIYSFTPISLMTYILKQPTVSNRGYQNRRK